MFSLVGVGFEISRVKVWENCLWGLYSVRDNGFAEIFWARDFRGKIAAIH